MKLKKVTPCGRMVLIKLVEQKKKEEYATLKSGVIIPTSINDGIGTATTQKGEKKTVVAYLEAFGPDIDQSKLNCKIGDEIMYNNYDLITLGDDEGVLYGLTKLESILAVVEAERG
jgi:co-chaperonin GroES (HSP10)